MKWFKQIQAWDQTHDLKENSMRFVGKHIPAVVLAALSSALAASVCSAQTADTSSANQIMVSSITLDSFCPPNPRSTQAAFDSVQRTMIISGMNFAFGGVTPVVNIGCGTFQRNFK